MKYANGFVRHRMKQRRAFVCAKTNKRMLELLAEFSVGLSEFYSYWNHCGNDMMKQLAKDKEGVWIASDSQRRDYLEHITESTALTGEKDGK